ncbi:hypothetical protein HAX54_024072, partial [Datura stramonium]|nr:hypothetical protein [Datura stramonium]
HHCGKGRNARGIITARHRGGGAIIGDTIVSWPIRPAQGNLLHTSVTFLGGLRPDGRNYLPETVLWPADPIVQAAQERPNANLINVAAGIDLADAYSPDTIIASSPGKEVPDPWVFYRHMVLLHQAFTHCKKFSTAASRRESGSCFSPSVADHPLRPATDHRLGKLLPHQLANQTRAPPRVGSSFCFSSYGVLAAVSSCCFPPKGRFLWFCSVAVRVTYLSTFPLSPQKYQTLPYVKLSEYD